MLRYGLLGLLAQKASDTVTLKADLEALFDDLPPATLKGIAGGLDRVMRGALG